MSLDPRERRLREEMAHHVEELEAELRREGRTPAEARDEAARRFGDPDHFARETAASSGRLRRWLDALAQDVRYAGRQTLRHPLMSGLTIGTLTIGVAATAIVYAVVDAVVLSPLPFESPDDVVHVSQTSPQGRLYSTSEPNFVDFRARQRSFTEMAGMAWDTPVLEGLEDPVSVDGRRVSHTFFGILGITPILGRDFLAEEDQYGGATDVVLLSEGAWERRFGRDPAVVGRTVALDGLGRRVVGVVPSDFAWPGVEVFTPLAPDPDLYRDDQRIEVVARLRPGVSLEDASVDLDRIARQLSDEYPESNDRWGAAVRPVREWLVGEHLTRLGGLLAGSVAIFLVMACASVSNLLLSRASTRVGEVGLRTALGAGQRRIATQLLTEAGVLATIGGALAIGVAYLGLRAVKAFGPSDVARLDGATIDASVLLMAATATVATVLVAGIAPLLLLAREEVSGALRSGGRNSRGAGASLRSVLVVAQFALAVTVVSGAGLMGRSFVRLQAVDVGFDAGGVVRFAVRLPTGRFDQAGREDFLERLGAEVETIPGVEAFGATTAGPFSPMRPSNFVARSDAEPGRQEDFQPVSWRAVSGDFFAAAGIPLLSGRVFDARDRRGTGGNVENPPVIIDRALAEVLFPGQDPIGRLVTWFLPGGQQCEIVGVVATARDERIDVTPRPRIYRPFTYTYWDQPDVLVRVAGDPAAAIPALRRATLAVDPSVPAIDPTTVSDDVRRTVAWPRFSMQVLGAFGLVALLLAALGIYGVTSFSVARRRHEIGVRIALGAEPTRVHWLVVSRALRLAASGIVAGVLLSLAATRLLEAFLYDVSPRDPATFLLVAVGMGLVALFSTWVPARRAVGLDPREALLSD